MNKLQNRARIMLTALGIFAVVGGALAFKARSTQSLYCTTQNAPNVCTSQIPFRTLEDQQLGEIGDIRCSTTSVNSLCATTQVFVGQ